MTWTSAAGCGGRLGAAIVPHAAPPLAAILTILLLIALFQHIALGLQVVIEDYVHATRSKLAVLLVVRLGCAALTVAGAFAVVRIALTR